MSRYKVALQVDTKIPKVPFTDYDKALRAEPTSHISAKLRFGEDLNSGDELNIQVSGNARSLNVYT